MPALTAALRAEIEAAVPPLPGWTTPAKACRLAELILETSAERSVEIGVFGGRGTIPMAMAHATLGRGYVAAVDPWEMAASIDGSNDPLNDTWWRNVDHESVFQGFLSALTQHQVLRYCRVIRERSATAAQRFADESIMVLHQDGNHSQQISTLDVQVWTPKVAHGGYWIADDTDWASTQGALIQLVEHGFELVDNHHSWRTYRRP